MDSVELDNMEALKDHVARMQKCLMSVDDPWAHRAKNMRCATCMWYVEKKSLGKRVGRCRRHAPTMNGYPVVFPHDWCGDHKLDETK